MRRSLVRTLTAALICAATLPAVPARAAGPQRLIIEPSAGTLLEIEGRYPPVPGICPVKQPKPLRAKYRGRLEIVKHGSRLDIVNELSFGEYLRGLAEMPAAWPPAALQAQAIAARSYAMHAYRQGRARSSARGYDICATDRCQVYRGATIELGAFGENWVAAVDATRGRVLTYSDAIIQAFYFSTSDGKTKRSFPGGTPQPWLPSVDGEDGDAPLARWEARFPLADLTAILRRARLWTSGARITQVTGSGDTVRLRGGSASRSVSRSDLRIALNNEAQCVSDERYPGRMSNGKRMPQAVPSRNYTLTQSGSVVSFRGRGWGHGVGMAQWGAKSLADRGRAARDILTHYYGPVSIGSISEPDDIRVLAAESLRVIRIAADGPVRVTTDTGSELASGTRFEVRGGASMRIARGRGPSLAPVLEVRASSATNAVKHGDPIEASIELSRPARVTARVLRGSEEVARVAETSYESGTATITVPLSGADGTPLAAGQYTLVADGYDGIDRVRSTPVSFTIEAVNVAATTTPDPPRDDTSGRLPLIIVAVVAALGAGWFAARALRRRRLSRT